MRAGYNEHPMPVLRGPANNGTPVIARGTPSSTPAPATATTTANSEREVSERIDKMEPAPLATTTYEARMGRGGFAGFADVDGAGAVQISKSPDGRTPSFLAEAGRPLRVVVDPAMISSTAKKVELAWYLASAGHDTKQRVTLADGDRDRRTGALVVSPGVVNVPEDAAGTLRLSIEVTGADGRVQSQWSPHYDAVVMPKGGATVVFDEDWSVTTSGALRGGEKLAIAYDADRLRNILGGADVDNAVAVVQFDGNAPLELPLTLKNDDGSVRRDATYMPALQVPFDAERVTVWFRGTAHGKTEHDSAFGKNFTFDVALPRDDADASWKAMALKIRGLPALTESNFTGIGPSDGGYNCIAWSVGTRNEWVWPGTTVKAFDELYAKHGYKPLDTLDAAALAHEPGVEKVLLYGYPANGTKQFEATHAARMGDDGKWTSKLGTDPLIRHEDPRVVEGPSYGKMARVYVRSRPAGDAGDGAGGGG